MEWKKELGFPDRPELKAQLSLTSWGVLASDNLSLFLINVKRKATTYITKL